MLFTDISLAFFIMGDGYWDNDSKTILICTESFTLDEVQFIIEILRKNFNLIATLKKRGVNYRLRFSSKENNLNLLRSLVLPHMHSQMLYKLGVPK